MGRRARHMNAKDAGASMVLDSRFLKLNDGDAIDAWPSRGTNVGATATTTLRPTYKKNQDSSHPAVQFVTNVTNRMLIDSGSADIFRNVSSGAIISVVKDFGTSTDAQRRIATFNTTTAGNVRHGIGSRFTTVGTCTFGRRADTDGAAVSTPTGAVTSPHIASAIALWGSNRLFSRNNGVSAASVGYASGAGLVANTASSTNTIGGVTTAVSRFWGNMYVIIAMAPIRSMPLINRIEQSMGFAFKIKTQ